MDKEQIYLEAKSELQVMIVKKKSENEGLRNFDVWILREKTNKARNAWRAEQRKLKVMVSESELREQYAKKVEKLSDEYTCPRLPHPAGMSSCDYCDGHQDGMYLAAQIVRGQK